MNNGLNETFLTFLNGIHQVSNNRPTPPPQEEITTSGKHTKLLKGAGRFPIYGFCGRTMDQNIPDMITFLDSNEDETTKYNELKKRLKQFQSRNAFMTFTLRKDTVKDLMKHRFSSEFEDKTMMKGFSPFCLYPLERRDENNLKNLEETMAQASTTSTNDYNRRNNALKMAPFSNPTSFCTAVCNTYALAKILFTSTSPLMQDLEELHEIALAGFHNGRLAEARNLQPTWFAHVLWSLHQRIYDFFEMQLSEDDLLEGAKLRHPLSRLLSDVERFAEYKIGGVPASIKPATTQTMPQGDGGSSNYRGGKRGWQQGQPGQEQDSKRYKKEPPPGHQPEPLPQDTNWRENPTFNNALKTTEQEITQKIGKTNLGVLIKASGKPMHDPLCALYFLGRLR